LARYEQQQVLREAVSAWLQHAAKASPPVVTPDKSVADDEVLFLRAKLVLFV
jgi:hypothetical protein